MVEAYLTPVSWFSFLILIGVILSFISIKIKIPDVLLLLLTGIIVGQLTMFEVNKEFLTAFGIFTLIMIVFNSTAKIKLKEFYQLSPHSLKLTGVFFILCIVLLSLFTHLLFSENWFSTKLLILSMIFGALMTGTSSSVILSLLKEKTEKLIKMIEIESIVNTPISVLVPFIMVDVYYGTLVTQIVLIKFLQSIMTGVGTGIVLGVIIFSLLKKNYQELISPLAIIASAFASYTLAENIGGNGVLAVTSFALVFGVMTIKEKETISKFSDIFTNFLRIIVFLLLGLIIKVQFEPWFIIKSIILFLLYLIIRFVAVNIAFRTVDLHWKEKIFITLNAAKGIAVAVMIFLLSSYAIEGMEVIVNLSLLFVLYSICLISFVVKFTDYFIVERKTVLKKKSTAE